MSIGLASVVGLVAGATASGFVYIGAAEISGSPVVGIVVAAIATVAQIMVVRTVKRLMESDAAAAAAARGAVANG